jgi:hypothetical protein
LRLRVILQNRSRNQIAVDPLMPSDRNGSALDALALGLEEWSEMVHVSDVW